MRSRRAIFAAMAGAAAMLAPTAFAQESPGRTIAFTANYTDPGTAITGVGGVTNACPTGYFSIDGTAQFDAPLSAVDNYHGCLFIDPAQQSPSGGTSMKARGDTWDTQTGTLAGCGSGSFVMHQTEIVLSYSSTSHTGHVSLKWTLEHGTGAFTGATGHGTGDGDFTPPSNDWRTPEQR